MPLMEDVLDKLCDARVFSTLDLKNGFFHVRVAEPSRKYGLEIKWSKCQFLQTRIEFLGHIVEDGKISPSPTKVSAVQNYPEPKSLADIHSFLGLTGYFRKYIPNYAKVAKPLSDLLKGKREFQFGLDQRTSFDQLKNSLSNEPVLAIFNPQCETELHTDASALGYGAVLLQRSSSDGQLHPVHYMSKKTTPQEEKYCSYELEVLAVVTALKKFRVYLFGTKFKLITDCSALQKTMNKKDLAPRVARWAMLMEEYNYEIEHRSGPRIPHADALSRHPQVLYAIEDGVVARIKRAQRADEGLNAVLDHLQHRPYKDFVLKDGILFKFSDGRETLVVPRSMQHEDCSSGADEPQDGRMWESDGFKGFAREEIEGAREPLETRTRLLKI